MSDLVALLRACLRRRRAVYEYAIVRANGETLMEGSGEESARRNLQQWSGASLWRRRVRIRAGGWRLIEQRPEDPDPQRAAAARNARRLQELPEAGD